MSDDRNDEAEFIERISKPLRAPELSDPSFEARAMSAIHAVVHQELMEDRRRSRQSWLVRPRKMYVSPLASLAVGAGFAALVLGGASLFQSAGRGSDGSRPTGAASIAARDTVHIVRFVLVDEGARSVTVVGSFNRWERQATVMQRTSNGVWVVDVPLPRGRHEYAFVVNDGVGDHWIADPAREALSDDFGTETSVVSVGRMPTS